MINIDLSDNPRISILMDMIASIRKAKTVRDVLEAFVRGMQMAYGPRCYINLSKRGLGPDEFRIVRWLTLELGDRVKPAEIGEEAFDTPVLKGGFLGELTASLAPKLIHHLDVKNDPVVGDRLSGYGSLIAVPLIESDLSVDWAVIFHQGPEAFTAADLEIMIIRANLINAAVDNVHINEKLIEAGKHIQREVDQIAQIQKSLLPEKLPELPGHTVASSYKTFDRAGGDHFDIFPLAELGPAAEDYNGKWVILIADAAGHGPSAAVIMAVFHAILHTFQQPVSGPAQILEYVNEHLYNQVEGTALMTAFLAIYEPEKRLLVYANAGHPPPLLRSDEKSIRLIELDGTDGLPLGIQAKAGLTELKVELKPGQTLLMYTDGVPDERSTEVVPFGLERLKEIVVENGDPESLLEQINRELVLHQGSTPPEDDQTLLVIRVDA